ncbi:MAG: PaaI family thioesterase [Cuniculiplasma sp.]
MEISERIKEIMKRDNYMSRFHLELEEAESGRIKLKAHLYPTLMRSGDMVNGGAIMSLFDFSGSLSIFTLEGVLNGFTISFNCDFLKPLLGSYAIVDAVVDTSGKSHAFIKMDMHDDNGRKVAYAHGIWVVYR